MFEKGTEEMLLVANDFTLFKNNITRVYLLLYKSTFRSLLYSYLWQTLKLFQITRYCTKYLIISRFGKIFDTGKISKYINTAEHYKTTTKFQAPNLRFRLALVHQQKHNKI